MYFVFHLPEIREVGKGSVDWPIGITNSETLMHSNFYKTITKSDSGVGWAFLPLQIFSYYDPNFIICPAS